MSFALAEETGRWWVPFGETDGVAIVYADLAPDAAREAEALAWLSDAELARRERFVDAAAGPALYPVPGRASRRPLRAAWMRQPRTRYRAWGIRQAFCAGGRSGCGNRLQREPQREATG